MSEQSELKVIRERKFVILFQLLVLALILGGLFGAIFIRPNQDATPATTVESQSTPKRQSDGSVLQKLDEVEVRAKAAYVFDIKNQRALYTKNESEVLPLASITKLMTALLAHELIAADTPAIISSRAIGQEGSSGLLPGENLSIEELNKLSLISSSNDAAYALGANVGELLGDRDPAAQFVVGMNIRAEELELNTLSFKNTTGLDLSLTEAGAVGSARDVTFLMEYILKTSSEIIEPTRQYNARVYNSEGEFHDFSNTNEVMYAIPNLLGSKTGYTDLAGGNLTVAFDAGYDRPIIVTVLGSTRDERFSDVLRLIQAVQSNITEI